MLFYLIILSIIFSLTSLLVLITQKDQDSLTDDQQEFENLVKIINKA